MASVQKQRGVDRQKAAWSEWITARGHYHMSLKMWESSRGDYYDLRLHAVCWALQMACTSIEVGTKAYLLSQPGFAGNVDEARKEFRKFKREPRRLSHDLVNLVAEVNEHGLNISLSKEEQADLALASKAYDNRAWTYADSHGELSFPSPHRLWPIAHCILVAAYESFYKASSKPGEIDAHGFKLVDVGGHEVEDFQALYDDAEQEVRPTGS